MSVKNVINKYKYHLPSSYEQLEQFAKEIQEEVFAELKRNMEGIVINGVLSGGLTEQRLKELHEKANKEIK